MPLRLLRLLPLLSRLLAGKRRELAKGDNGPAQPEKTLDNPDIQKTGPFSRGEAIEFQGFDKKIVHSEDIFSGFLFVLFTSGVVLTGIIAASVPSDPDPLTESGLSVVTLLFFVFLFLAINFSSLRIRMTFDHLTARYGVFSYRADWLAVKDIIIERNNSGASPNRGIRMRSIGEGTWRLYYSTGLPRVILVFEDGAIRELAFSSNSPEKAMTAARECIRRKKARYESAAHKGEVHPGSGPEIPRPLHLAKQKSGKNQ
ncbi:MAG TPA: hypothetical protein P5541_05595 [Thermovirgaceae bacterium]|nr:hypothetical protein [Thermovirgaceae bacterium]